MIKRPAIIEEPSTSPDIEEWFRIAYPTLRRFAAVVAPASVTPDDLVQDALVRLLRRGGLERLDDPTAYLCRTIANLATDRRRHWHRARKAWILLRSSSTDVENVYPSDLSDLSLLTSRERATVYLHDVEGLPFEEIGDLLGCSPAAARQAATRGRGRLRAVVEVTR